MRDRFSRPAGVWVDPPALNRLTAFARRAPGFLVIGAQRSGTTSLYQYLTAHPQVLPALRKEVHYFDFQHGKGRRWYLAHFPPVLSRQGDGRRWITGEASPYYLAHPLAAARVQAVDAKMKLIAILRNPVERAWSQYRHEVRRGVEWLSFEAALEAEPERLSGAAEQLCRAPHFYSYAHHHFAYLDRGRYAHYLERWLTQFPRRQVLLLRSEEMFRDANRIANKAFAFLELPPHQLQVKPSPGVAAPGTPLEPPVRQRLERHFAADQEMLTRIWDSSA